MQQTGLKPAGVPESQQTATYTRKEAGYTVTAAHEAIDTVCTYMQLLKPDRGRSTPLDTMVHQALDRCSSSYMTLHCR